MSGSIASMALQCKHCHDQWPDDTVVEALLLHFQIEHDTDKVEMNLVAVCRCSLVMEFTDSTPIANKPGMIADHFKCSCGREGYLKRGKS